jgi:hypothetical protein
MPAEALFTDCDRRRSAFVSWFVARAESEALKRASSFAVSATFMIVFMRLSSVSDESRLAVCKLSAL